MSDYMTCKNIDDFFDNAQLEMLNVSIEGKTRVFCKCGQVHTKRVYECPYCKRKGAFWVDTCGRYNRELYEKFDIIRTPDGFKIDKRGFTIEANTKTEELEIKEYIKETILEKDSSGLTFFVKDYKLRNFLSKLDKIDIEEIKKNDSSFFPEYETFDFNSFFNVFTVFSCKEDSPSINYCLYALFKKQVPWMFNRKEIYPCLLALYFSNLSVLNTYGSIDSYIKEFHLENFRPFLKFSWLYEKTYGYRNPFDKPSNILFDNLSKGYKDLLIYYLEHYKLSYRQIIDIAKELKEAIDNSFICDKNDELFIKYIKENLISSKENIIKAYINDLSWLKKLKLGKTHENIRNINFLRNAETLKESGYPDKKIGIFMDSFYDNPLKASYYLKSKKDLTKKEIEAFIEEQTK